MCRNIKRQQSIIIATIKIITVTNSVYDLYQLQRLKLSRPPPLHSAPIRCPKIYVNKAAVGFGFQAFLFKSLIYFDRIVLLYRYVVLNMGDKRYADRL